MILFSSTLTHSQCDAGDITNLPTPLAWKAELTSVVQLEYFILFEILFLRHSVIHQIYSGCSSSQNLEARPHGERSIASL